MTDQIAEGGHPLPVDTSLQLSAAEQAAAVAALPIAPKCALTDRVAALEAGAEKIAGVIAKVEAQVAKVEPLLPPNISARIDAAEAAIAALEAAVEAVEDLVKAVEVAAPGVVSQAKASAPVVKALEGRVEALVAALKSHFNIKL